jgi:hypothetical protein
LEPDLASGHSGTPALGKYARNAPFAPRWPNSPESRSFPARQVPSVQVRRCHARKSASFDEKTAALTICCVLKYTYQTKTYVDFHPNLIAGLRSVVVAAPSAEAHRVGPSFEFRIDARHGASGKSR